MYEKTLPRQADLATRKIAYYAAKFGQWWSVRQLRQTSDLIHRTFAGLPSPMKTETLPSDHSFFNAWGPPHMGMGYRGLDLLEIGGQQAVDVLSAEDWLGLNHMYGPGTTWTGAAAFGYFSAILRSGIGDRPVALRGLITPSDDGYLRLKAYTALGQGAKSFFFWTFGPTYIGTENYWSDLRSEYDGIAKFTRALEKSEKVLYPARPVRDPVAILYSVSHDLWHTDDPASFVENRLTWTALRHLGVQPDFLREEDVEAGRLAAYKVLYVTGQCLTRKAARRIDDWVKAGGVVYLAAGAATRDEFYEPCIPPFAAAVWPDRAAERFLRQSGHRYNERADLPTIQPITRAKVVLEGKDSSIPVIGCRLDLKEKARPGLDLGHLRRRPHRRGDRRPRPGSGHRRRLSAGAGVLAVQGRPNHFGRGLAAAAPGGNFTSLAAWIEIPAGRRALGARRGSQSADRPGRLGPGAGESHLQADPEAEDRPGFDRAFPWCRKHGSRKRHRDTDNSRCGVANAAGVDRHRHAGEALSRVA